MSKNNAIADMKMCDILIQTREIAKQKVFNISAMWKIAESGYNNTIKLIEETEKNGTFLPDNKYE